MVAATKEVVVHVLHTLKNFKYLKFNLLEWMHNLARAFDNFLDVLVGREDESYERRSRDSSRALGLFPEISSPVILSRVRTEALSELDDEAIGVGNSTWCRRWLRLCGIVLPQDSTIQQLRDRVIEV